MAYAGMAAALVGLVFGVAALILLALAASWASKSTLERLAPARLRLLMLAALALLGLALLGAESWRQLPAAEWVGAALLMGLALHLLSNADTPDAERRKRRARWAALTGVAAFALAVGVVSQVGRIEDWTARRELARLQERTGPLIAQLEWFRSERGRWPTSKEELLEYVRPHVIDELPDLDWRVGDSDVGEHCVVFDRSRLLDFDYFVYAPGVAFPADLPATRVGDWVWYDE